MTSPIIVALIMDRWRRGQNTLAIARALKLPEHEVYNVLARSRSGS